MSDLALAVGPAHPSLSWPPSIFLRKSDSLQGSSREEYQRELNTFLNDIDANAFKAILHDLSRNGNDAPMS